MDDHDTIETFFWCSQCRLPHGAGTRLCPVTGQPVGLALPRPEALPPIPRDRAAELRATVRSPAVHAGGGGAALVQPSATELTAGQILDHKYAVGEVIGAGAMGTVYEGRHVLLGRAVAIKAIGPAQRRHLDVQARFLDEGRVLASIAHPHVVHVYDLGICDGVPYLVLERLEGETLDARIKRLGALPFDEALIITRQILSGLGAVHRHGVVHRDLKPANIFLVASRDGLPHVKILDFGVSTPIVADDGSGRGSGQIIGTPSFLAPEQIRGEAVDERADLWALGVCLYEMLTGALPFAAESFNGLVVAIAEEQPLAPGARRPGVPPSLDRVVARALQKRRGDRFASAQEMRGALAPSASEEGEIQVDPLRELALVAEPDPHAAEGQAAIARELGLFPILVADGAEAREMITSVGAPRLLFLNLALAGIDGFTLLRELREVLVRAGTVAVAFSPVSELRAAARARREELGLAAVLDAGLGPDVVQAVARRALADNNLAPESQPASLALSPPVDEAGRLDRIAAMELVDERPQDAALQRLVEETASAFGVPVALVSLVLRDRQWFLAHAGLGGELLANRGSPREWSFCRHVVESGAPLVVPDARAHPAFADNPLVVDGTVGSYAGAPVVTPTGEVLGTLCIIDHVQNPIGHEKVEDLVLLARRVAGELEIRARRSAAGERKSEGGTTLHRLMAVLANLDTALMLLGADRRIVFANQALADLAGVSVEALLGLTREAFLALFAPAFRDPADYLRRVRVLAEGPFAGREDLATTRQVLRWSAKPVEMKDGLGHLETYTELPAA